MRYRKCSMIKCEMENSKEIPAVFKWTREFNSPPPILPELLGNKGANLAEMKRLGLPVPDGFTLTTEAWRQFSQNEQIPPKIWQETLEQLKILEEKTGKRFADAENPLIVSVRSGAFYSMPGMMETISNIGLTKETKKGLTKQVGKVCAEDSHQRLKKVFKRITGEEPPVDPYTQLKTGIEAVFSSWNNPKAQIYRKYNGIPEAAGTAVTIQEMVFGNIDDGKSGTGVFFSRDPITGEKKPAGEFVFAGQGEDIVQEKRQTREIPPKLVEKLAEFGRALEAHFRTPQDIEFTVEKGKLFLLQSRTLQGAPLAKTRMAIGFYNEGLISRNESYQKVRPSDIQMILRPSFEPRALAEARKKSLIGKGKPASIGAAVGKVVFTPAEARELGKKDEKVILVCPQLDPNDIETFFNLAALVTTEGGTASHMALVSQALGKVAVASVEFKRKPKKGESLSVNGTGEVFTGRIPFAEKPELGEDVKNFVKEWKNVWGESAWASALYPTEKEYSRQAFLEKIEEITPELKKWRSDKAQTIILLTALLPRDEIIPAVVLPPDDIEGIHQALKEVVLQEGRQNIPRTCHHPEKLTGAPYVIIPTAKEIESFLKDPSFSGYPQKYGGLIKWKEDPTLVGIIVPVEPEGKIDPDLTHEHFVFTVSCLPSWPPRIVVDLNLETPLLRSFEQVKASRLIQIIASLNYDSPYYLGEIEVVFGKDYQNDPYAQQVAQIVKEKVFEQWWRPPFSLPHVLSVLDETYELSVLEGQGRMRDKKELAWCLVYGAKGREEKEKAKGMIW